MDLRIRFQSNYRQTYSKWNILNRNIQKNYEHNRYFVFYKHTHTQKTNSDNYKKIPGVGIPAVALIFLSLLDSGKATVISLLVIAVGFNAAIFCGFNVNHIDLSPNHSGTLMGITNGFSNIFSIVAPLLVQYIVTDEVRQQINNIFVT